MTEKKTHDLRNDIPARTSITDTQSRMAGSADNPNIAAKNNPPLSKPGPDTRKPEGQGTKSN